jgi:hypothetical protein
MGKLLEWMEKVSNAELVDRTSTRQAHIDLLQSFKKEKK